MLPEFPLIPASRGFCITLRKALTIFKTVLIKEAIINRPSEWQDSENVKELMNNIANQCQETSEFVLDSKVAKCNSNSSNVSQESNNKSTSSGNQFKGVVSSLTNDFAVTQNETKKDTSSQNTS